MIKIEQITDNNLKEKWNEFVLSEQSDEPFGSFSGSFFQSWEWGEFQKLLGRKIFRFVIKNENIEWLGACCFIKHNLPFGKSQLYAPRGPVLRKIIWKEEISQEIFLKILEAIKPAREENRGIFLRIEPSLQFAPPFLSDLRFQSFYDDVQPRQNQILDLRKSEEELFSEMHPSARHNIRLARKRGVIIKERVEKDISDIDIFLNHLHSTLKRQKFGVHPRAYYEIMLDYFPRKRENGNKNAVKIIFFEALRQEKSVAANLVFLFGKHATYLFGGSDLVQKNLKAPVLLHWETMLNLKKAGYLSYDLGGISEKKWPGLTDFKTRFGGSTINLIGPYDFIFEPFWYYIYKWGRKFKRGL